MFSSFFFLFGADSCLEHERHNWAKYFRFNNSCICNTISYCVGSGHNKCLETEKKKELNITEECMSSGRIEATTFQKALKID